MSDNTILITKSRNDANILRNAVLDKFRDKRPWVCLYVEGENIRVTIDGPWGSRLPSSEEKEIKSFAKKFGKTTPDPVPKKTRKN